jgi:hypothetical protein
MFLLASVEAYFEGALDGRLIFPITQDGKHVGWQARLSFEPSVFNKDRNFQYLRWVSMPGSRWRSRHVFGYDQAKGSDVCVVVEHRLQDSLSVSNDVGAA